MLPKRNTVSHHNIIVKLLYSRLEFPQYHKRLYTICMIMCIRFSIYLCFYFYFIFLATLHGMWDLSSPTRNDTPCSQHWKHGVITTGPPGKSLIYLFKGNIIKSPFPSSHFSSITISLVSLFSKILGNFFFCLCPSIGTS